MDRESREGRSAGDGGTADDFKLAWGEAEDRWTEAAEDKSEFSPKGPPPEQPSERAGLSDSVPWDELAEDSSPQFEDASPVSAESRLVPDSEADDADEVDDESPPHGDPLEAKADAIFDPGRPQTRMDSLQDALASIRDRVQSLSGATQAGGGGQARTSQLALYRAATDDRTLGELKRHSRDTEDLLRRMSALMQDLSLDLRSIVDAARRAIDQTSEQAESSIELGRLLGERIEQMDDQLSARVDELGVMLAQRVDQMDAAVGSLQVHLDKRLTKLEQRAGVGVLREELGDVRADLGEMRTDLGEVRTDFGEVRTDFGEVRTELSDVRADLGDVRSELTAVRDEVGAVSDSGGAGLQERLDVVGTQLDRTLSLLRDVMEGAPDQDGDVVDGVIEAIKGETEAAVEPFRAEVEELGRQLGEALDREEQLGTTLSTLTDEVQRLRKRIAVRAAPPSIDDQQIQTIVDAVVAAMPSGAAPEAVDAEPEPEPEPAAARTRRRARPARARKAPATEPEYEADLDERFAPDDLDVDDSHLDVEAEEEPIRRARGTTKKSTRTLAKGRRTRSSSR